MLEALNYISIYRTTLLIVNDGERTEFALRNQNKI